jgi:toxin ParE1/3/4
MSARKPKFSLAPEARQDLSDILVYTDRQWGRRQRGVYKAKLRRGFVALRDNPHLGLAREDLRPGLRALSVEHHVLYYRIIDGTIEIVRILHERADAARHLSR